MFRVRRVTAESGGSDRRALYFSAGGSGRRRLHREGTPVHDRLLSASAQGDRAARPWLIYGDGSLHSDYCTEADQSAISAW